MGVTPGGASCEARCERRPPPRGGFHRGSSDYHGARQRKRRTCAPRDAPLLPCLLSLFSTVREARELSAACHSAKSWGRWQTAPAGASAFRLVVCLPKSWGACQPATLCRSPLNNDAATT